MEDNLLDTTGTATSPQAYKFYWESHAVPASLEDKIDEALKSAGEPDLFTTRSEKYKEEVSVTKKPALPFLKPTTEKQVVYKKREIKERLEMLPEELERGYIKKGDLILTVEPFEPKHEKKPARAGSIHETLAQSSTVYLGKNVKQKMNRYLAEVDGFYRRGTNWVDIVPEKSAEQSSSSDGTFSLTVFPDKLRAVLTVEKHRGNGKPLSLEALGYEIKKSQLRRMNVKKVQADILNFIKGESAVLRDYSLAEGKSPQRGEDGQLKFETGFLTPEKTQSTKEYLTLRLGKPGFISSRTDKEFSPEFIQKMALVNQGQEVARIIPPTQGKAGYDVYNNPLAGVSGNDPDIKIIENLQISKNSIVAVREGLLLIGKDRSTHYLSIIEFKDAEFALKLSDGKMECFLSIQPAVGEGKPVSLQTLKQALTEQNIIKGVDEKQLGDFIEQARRGVKVSQALMARGQHPRHGSGSRLEFHCLVASGLSRNVYQDHSQSSENKKKVVNKGDLIAEIIPSPVSPRDGWNLCGETVKAQHGLPITVVNGQNIIKQTETNGTVKFFANKSGEVFYDGSLLEIKDSMVIESSVDASTGDINFSGTIVIKGDIKEGFKVFSGADIKVGGAVEGAILSSEGSILVQGGIRGKKRAILRSKNNVRAPFAENALILAVGDTQIMNSCLNCTIKCNGKMVLAKEKSNFVAGILRARKGMELVNLGSSNQVKTQVSFGQDYLVSDQIELEEREIKKLQQKIFSMDFLMNQIEKSGGQEKERLYQLRREKLLALRNLETRSIRLFNLREKFEEHFPAEVVVRGTLFPGVVFESHGRIHEIKEKKSRVTIFFDAKKGKIGEKPLNN